MVTNPLEKVRAKAGKWEMKRERSPRYKNKPLRKIRYYFTPLNREISTVLTEMEKQ